MVQNREARIDQSMRRFSDPRFRPGARNADGGYLPVLGASWNVSIAYTPVTNEDYAQFLKATGRKAPKDWDNGAMPAGKGRHPVVNVPMTTLLPIANGCRSRMGKPFTACRLKRSGSLPPGICPRMRILIAARETGHLPWTPMPRHPAPAERLICGAIAGNGLLLQLKFPRPWHTVKRSWR